MSTCKSILFCWYAEPLVGMCTCTGSLTSQIRVAGDTSILGSERGVDLHSIIDNIDYVVYIIYDSI